MMTGWYSEEAGFFGPGYLKEYADILTPERTISEVDFLEKALRLKSGMKILDLACGHGRHTVELAKRGYTMTGLDINSFFLGEARRAAQNAGVKIRWIKSDMREVPFENEFDAVLNLFTAFGYFESDKEDQKVLHQVAKALRPKGQFVMDFIDQEWILRFFKEKDWQELPDGSLVIMERKFDHATGRNHERRIRIWKSGQREEFNIVVRMYTLSELVDMCEEAGFQFQKVYGDYRGGGHTIESRRHILILDLDRRTE